MHIKKLRIQNYKSFRDSGFMEFGPSFNVIVGQNNSGKTALLEALMLHNTPNKPHKRRDVKEFHQLDPYSDFEVDLVLSGVDLVDAWISRHGPVEQVRLDQLKQLSPLASFGVQLDTTIALKWNPNKNWQIRDELSRPLPLVLTAKGEFIDPSYGPPRSDLFLNLGPNDQNELVHLAQAALSGRTFGFKAERMNIAASGFDNGGPLSPGWPSTQATSAPMAATGDLIWAEAGALPGTPGSGSTVP